MQVYSYHKDQSYENVVSAANRFIEFHPYDKDVPYAYYLIGLSIMTVCWRLVVIRNWQKKR